MPAIKRVAQNTNTHAQKEEEEINGNFVIKSENQTMKSTSEIQILSNMEKFIFSHIIFWCISWRGDEICLCVCDCVYVSKKETMWQHTEQMKPTIQFVQCCRMSHSPLDVWCTKCSYNLLFAAAAVSFFHHCWQQESQDLLFYFYSLQWKCLIKNESFFCPDSI